MGDFELCTYLYIDTNKSFVFEYWTILKRDDTLIWKFYLFTCPKANYVLKFIWPIYKNNCDQCVPFFFKEQHTVGTLL